MNIERLSIPERVSAISMVVVAVAAFLPWMSSRGIVRFGLRVDGVVTLALSVAGLVALAVISGALGGPASPRRSARVFLLLLALLALVVSLLNLRHLRYASIGLWLTILGSIAWTFGSIWELVAVIGKPSHDAAPEEGGTS